MTIAAAVAAFAAGCGGATTTTSINEITGPSGERCQTTVNGPSTVSYTGSRLTFSVVAPRECTWTASSESSWVQVSPGNGQGEATISATVAENDDARARSATLVVNDARVTVTQEAAPCRYQLGSSEARMSHDGGRLGIRVNTSGGCTWNATSSASWARVVTSSGSGAATVQVDVQENAGGQRTATINVSGQSFSLTQDSRAATPPPSAPPAPPPPPPPTPTPPPPSCSSTTLDSSERTVGASGGSGSFRVNAPQGCSWNATVDNGWVSLSGASGSGQGTVSYTVGANTTQHARSATISVAGRTFVVRQEAPPPPRDEDERINLSGRAFFVDGSCPNLTFVVDMRRVFTNGETRFRGDGCRDIRWGTDLRVEGRLQSDGRVRATEVRVRGRDDDDDDDN